jgi:hypothetical protein
MCSRAQCSAGRFFGKDGIKREREAGLDPVLHGNWEAAVAVVTRSFFFNGDFVPAGPRLESSLQCSRGFVKGTKSRKQPAACYHFVQYAEKCSFSKKRVARFIHDRNMSHFQVAAERIA